MLPPVWVDGALLVDGGVVNDTPISHAAELGAHRIYVLPTDDPASRGLSRPPRGALDAAVHAFRLLANARLRADIERYHSELDLIVLPAANSSRVQPTDFTHAEELLDGAYQAVSQMLQDERSPLVRVENTMPALSMMIAPTPDGWGVFLSDGRQLARFRGIAARWRALRYLTNLTGLSS